MSTQNTIILIAIIIIAAIFSETLSLFELKAKVLPYLDAIKKESDVVECQTVHESLHFDKDAYLTNLKDTNRSKLESIYKQLAQNKLQIEAASEGFKKSRKAIFTWAYCELEINEPRNTHYMVVTKCKNLTKRIHLIKQSDIAWALGKF